MGCYRNLEGGYVFFKEPLRLVDVLSIENNPGRSVSFNAFDNVLFSDFHFVERSGEIGEILELADLPEVVNELFGHGLIEKHFFDERSVKAIFNFLYIDNLHSMAPAAQV
jgi:hypothetical protein